MDTLSVADKIVIIQASTLDDVKILTTRYSHLIHDTTDFDERQHLMVLKTTTEHRIKELTTTHG